MPNSIPSAYGNQNGSVASTIRSAWRCVTRSEDSRTIDAATADPATAATTTRVASITMDGTPANGANAWATSGGYE